MTPVPRLGTIRCPKESNATHSALRGHLANAAERSPNQLGLSRESFSAAFSTAGVGLPPEDIQTLFVHFSQGGSAIADYREIVSAVQGILPEARRSILERAFTSLDLKKNGIVPIAHIMASFNGPGHPDVDDRNAKSVRTAVDVCNEFRSSFNPSTMPSLVTLDDFLMYYGDVSALIEDDTCV